MGFRNFRPSSTGHPAGPPRWRARRPEADPPDLDLQNGLCRLPCWVLMAALVLASGGMVEAWHLGKAALLAELRADPAICRALWDDPSSWPLRHASPASTPAPKPPGPYLLCKDGTRSPTCLCSRRSYSGCCSSHGGVDRCEDPTFKRP